MREKPSFFFFYLIPITIHFAHALSCGKFMSTHDKLRKCTGVFEIIVFFTKEPVC